MIKNLLGGIDNRKLLFFAMNNTCNNRCKMCSIWKMKEKKVVSFEKAKEALTKFYSRGFRFLQLTGGEPLLNPDFFRILGFAKKLGFIVFFPSNGILINREIAEKLAESKVDHVSISMHHSDPEVFEKISGHKNILKKTLDAVKYLRQAGVPVSALCTITKDNYKDIEDIVKFLKGLKLSVSFCTPMSINKTSFALGGKSVEFSKDELKRVIAHIIGLKKKYRNIFNCRDFLEDALSFLDGRKSRHSCLGGKKIFYLDWDMKVFPCMYRGNGTDVNKFFPYKEESNSCEKCLQQCFRESSIFLKSDLDAIRIVMKEPLTYISFIKNSYLKGLQH
ncbi:MAG: radical SAM protein [Candidatus Aenigmatarchaeota archaeon]